MSQHGGWSKPCPFCEEDSLADSVLNHVLARHEMDLVGDGAPEGFHKFLGQVRIL